MKKVIFLVDMNSFYVTCELLRYPQYKKQALIISSKGKRAVVTAASYAAKKQGIDSAMSLKNALKINPEIIILEPDFTYYRQQSERIMHFLKQFSDKLQTASIDEAYLDVSHYFTSVTRTQANILQLASFIQKKLLTEVGFPANIGVSTNKFLAKMASELDKPFKVESLFIFEITEKLWPLPIDKMHGIGKKTARVLQYINIQTIGDFATFANEGLLVNLLGNNILEKQQYARGMIDETIEDVHERQRRKSISHSRTFMEDEVRQKVLLQRLTELWEAVVADLHTQKLKVRGLRVFYKQSDFQTMQRSLTFEDYRADFTKLYEIGRQLFDTLWEGEPIRLLGIGVFDFIDAAQHAEQLTIFQISWKDVPERIQKEKKTAALDFVTQQNVDYQLITAKELLETKKQKK